MKVIAIVARKGGVGKTSLVRSLAVQAAIDGLRPAILDADEQQTIVRWSKRREAKVPAIFDLKAGSIAKAVEQIRAKSADVCFIDCPPHNAPSINVAVELADFALIVTEPAAESIEQIASVVAIAKGLKRPTGILINKAPPKSNALTLTRSALTAFDVSVCQTALTSLLVYPYSAAEGTSPQEREPKGKAAREIAEVWQWAKQLSGLMQDDRESRETVDDDKQRMRKRG